jgi:hypothetical protein
VLVLAVAGALLPLVAARRVSIRGLDRGEETLPLLNVLWFYMLWPWRDPGLALACLVVALLALLLRVPARLPALALEAGVFAAGLALYTLTLAPDVLPADAGEFQLVAAQLGVAHPPGYPLYTLLARGFTLLPFGTVAWRVNWFSAVAAAGALALTAHAARLASGSRWGGLAAAVVLATATSVWATATQASIRPLMALFTAGMLAAAIALVRREPVPDSEQPPEPTPAAGGRAAAGSLGAAAGFALALGLGLGHHLSLAFVGAILALYALPAALGRVRPAWRLVAPAAAFTLSFAVLLYLPWREPRLAEPAALLDHLLARGFEGDQFYFLTREPALLAERLALLPGLLAFAFDPLALLAAAGGAVLLLWQDRRLALALAGAWALHTFVTLTYRAPQTVEYLVPAYVLMAVAAGYLAGHLARHAARPGAPAATAALAALGTALVIWSGIAQGVRLAPSLLYLARDDDTRATALELLASAPDGAALLANWHWWTPLRYLQAVEGLRPDVAVVYVYPRGEPLADSWVNTIRAELAERPVVVTQFFDPAYAASGLRFEPLGREAWAVRAQPRTAAPDGLTRVDADFGGALRLIGYRVEPGLGAAGEHAGGDTLVLTVAWTPLRALQRDLHFFVHVLGPDGIPIAQSDSAAPASRTAPGEVVIDRHVLPLPVAAPPGRYRLTTGVYDVPDEGGFLRLTLPDGSDVLALPEIALAHSRWPLPTQHPVRWLYPGGLELAGYDYEASTQRLYLQWRGPAGSAAYTVQISGYGQELPPITLPLAAFGAGFTTVHQPIAYHPDGPALAVSVRAGDAVLAPAAAWGLPPFDGRLSLLLAPGERYVPLGGELILAGATSLPEPCGAAPVVTLTWLAARPPARDRVVSLQLAGDFAAQSDGVPALGAIPTLKWLHGQAIADRHVLALPDGAAGRATASLLVYDAFTLRPLAVLDPQIAQQGPRVPLGSCGR